jgi:hypothetical protein
MTLRDPDWYHIFAPYGLPLRKGQNIKRTNYSRTLAKIASEGSKAFYEVQNCIIRLFFFAFIGIIPRVPYPILYFGKYILEAVSLPKAIS